jgi:uncharacterized Zn ribbon protein
VSYPSAKNVGLIIFAIFLVVGALFYTNYRNKNTVQHTFENPDVVVTVDEKEIAEIQNLDTDEDGLKDWEEALWGTDHRNPDTDGDTSTDGDEVTSNRDPNVKGPNDKIKIATATASSSENLTTTDKFGRDIFAKYIELKQAGLASDPDSQQEIIREILSSGEFFVYKKIYTMEDVNTSDIYDSESLRAYGNQVATVFQKNMSRARDEATIVKDSLDKDDPNILKELDPIIASDKAILNGLLAMQVPKVAARPHLDLINAVSGATFVAQSLRQSNADPLVALQAIGEYQNTSRDLFDSLNQLKTMFSLSFIKFSSTEPGYVFSASLQ